jgi:hypothetical protein
MAKKTIAQLQALFITGYVPTQQDYADVFESYANLSVADLIQLISGVKVSNADATVGVTFGASDLGLDGTILLENYTSSKSKNIIVSPAGLLIAQRMPQRYYALLSQGTATTATSGTLVLGREYTVTNYVAGDDFTNLLLVQGDENTTGAVYFVYNQLTPNDWSNGSQLDYGGEPYVVSEIDGVASVFLNTIESGLNRIRFTRGGVGTYTVTCDTVSMFPLAKTDIQFGIGSTEFGPIGMVVARDTTSQPNTITFETLDTVTGLPADELLYYTAIRIDVWY